MNLKIFASFFILALILVGTQAYAQSDTSRVINNELLQITIEENGDASVIHKIKNLNESGFLELVKGSVSTVKVTNELGIVETIEMTDESNMIPILEDQGKLTIEYTLHKAVILANDVWSFDYTYPDPKYIDRDTTIFVIPDKVDLLFVNDRPVYFENEKIFACHGCKVVLEYSIDQPEIIKQVIWEEKEFDVKLNSYSEIGNFEFSQPEKKISFTVSENDQFVDVTFPLELLWGPYLVLLDEEKIPFHEYNNNGTHVSLNIRPDSVGEISIIGTTVVPEFSVFAPLAIGFMIIIMVPLIRKFNLR